MISILLLILGGIFSITFNLLDALPAFSFTIPENLFDTISSILNGISFFLPMATIAMIFQCKMLLIGFRLAYSLVLRIKSFIPTFGD